jgi:A/G-specific adenine glycosylase
MTSWPSRLLRWYGTHRRDLPWRGHPDPYAVWVSEIMLQQTRITTVRPYFLRFMERFPTLRALAGAPVAEVLKEWEGLGYYSRARNLQAAAQQILAEHSGEIPRTAHALATLPGIGPYTAAAIASICFGEQVPVVDGNVARVGSRYLGWRDDFRRPAARRKLAAWLQPALTAARTPGDLNQALMELGERICLPRTPACADCPLAATCHAGRSGTQSRFPFRPPPRTVPTRHAAAVLLRRRDLWLLMQRPADGLLGGFWELPGGECPEAADAQQARDAVSRLTGVTPVGLTLLGTWEHRFSHFLLSLRVFASQGGKGRLAVCGRGVRAAWVATEALQQLPVATLHRRILAHVSGNLTTNR